MRFAPVVAIWMIAGCGAPAGQRRRSVLRARRLAVDRAVGRRADRGEPTDEELAELAAQEPACIFLGFGEGPLSEAASLRRLLGYTMADDPGAWR
jgi:hypothetical protein